TQPYAPQYMWSNGATSQTISLGGWPGSYCVTVMDSVGCHADTCGYFNPAPDSVWPGDCDFNGVANIFDLLPIGFGYNQQGPIRNNATLNWVAQQANPYNSSYLNGVDYKHADCNGDGIVDLNDASAILLNYGLTHNKGENDPPTLLGVPTLSFQPSVDTVTVGSPVSIPIHLGDAQNSVDSIYGFIFNINIDTSLVKPGGSISYNPSWMGTLNTDLITLQREDLSNQIIINGMVRNDQLNQSGFGEIAQLNIVMQDDIAGKTYIFDTLNLSFSDVFAITFSGDTVSVNQSNQSIIVKQSTSTTGTESFVYDPFKVYPNPTQGSIWVDGPINKYDVLDARGTLLKSQEVGQQSNIKLELDLPNGLYFIRLNNHWTRKITIRN
ncbi:MAG: T9SS type A sorting domain-containing protein, partial [Flavobacteriales bacterium]|nr:T9SS type A sorting domain-containing protein [Flavobacteriales bacterium]